jgi:iron complex transport system substrate-binding protein
VFVPELRLLPLLSSATEIVHALGLGEFQVGRSHECDYPPHVLNLPVCTEPSFPVSGSSREIDGLVKERLATALSVYQVNAELIRELRPTHIITQTQCKVCAVSLDDVERAVRDQLETNAQIIPLEAYALAGLWQDIRQVAERCDASAAGEKLIQDLHDRMSEIEKQAAKESRSPTVAAIEWIDPLMAAGNWVPELIEMANGRNLFGVAGEHSPWMTFEQLTAADPDVIVALPCGFDLTRTREEARQLQALPSWSNLKAVHTGNVFVCDGNQFMNRPGPRLLESLRIFAEILHPELFEPSLEGIGWERF